MLGWVRKMMREEPASPPSYDELSRSPLFMALMDRDLAELRRRHGAKWPEEREECMKGSIQSAYRERHSYPEALAEAVEKHAPHLTPY